LKKDTNLIIIGAGETARLAYKYFTYDSEYNVVAFAIDKEYKKLDTLYDLPIINLENIETKYPKNKFNVFVAVAFKHLNRDRIGLYNRIKKMGYKCASYISSKASIWKDIKIGENCFILENNTIQPFSQIGNNVIIWSNTFIGHRSIIHDNCFIASQVAISGFCEIENNCFIGTNTSIADGINIAQDNFIAMGAVIHKNTKANSVYKGVPARIDNIKAKDFCKVIE
jgi:sugar O-acyltransferase (sialic acid O-acetyltransferase NeuD family)